MPNIDNFWWRKEQPHPTRGKKLKAPWQYATKQTYENYHKEYYKTPAGKEAHNKANRKYREKIAELYGLPYKKAAVLHKQAREANND